MSDNGDPGPFSGMYWDWLKANVCHFGLLAHAIRCTTVIVFSRSHPGPRFLVAPKRRPPEKVGSQLFLDPEQSFQFLSSVFEHVSLLLKILKLSDLIQAFLFLSPTA